MAKAVTRTHVVVPTELMETIDALVGRRGRSRFLAEAAEEKLRRVRLADIARRVGGSLAAVDTPDWESSEAAREWVGALRHAGTERFERD